MLLIDALQKKEVKHPPLWVMRQAGRYLPEYQELRKQAGSFFALCDTPDWAAEVTLQPIRRFDLDAAIIFSDILVIPRALGQQVDFIEGKGPVVEKLKDVQDVENLLTEPTHVLEKTQPTVTAIGQVRQDLATDKALIGFCGAPWTLALYMLDDAPAKGGHTARQWAYAQPEAFQKLLDKIVAASVTYLDAQIQAGANVVQVFDSWAGQAPANLFEQVVQAPILAICKALKEKHPDVPIIVFARGVQQHRLVQLVEASQGVFDGLGLDEAVDIKWAADMLQLKVCVQGNLDPAILLTTPEKVQAEARKIMDILHRNPGFIFNLGHGILPPTPLENMAALRAAVA